MIVGGYQSQVRLNYKTVRIARIPCGYASANTIAKGCVSLNYFDINRNIKIIKVFRISIPILTFKTYNI